MQPVQLSLIPDPPPTQWQTRCRRRRHRQRALPAEAVAAATALLAGVIAKAAAPSRSEVAGDE